MADYLKFYDYYFKGQSQIALTTCLVLSAIFERIAEDQHRPIRATYSSLGRRVNMKPRIVKIHVANLAHTGIIRISRTGEYPPEIFIPIETSEMTNIYSDYIPYFPYIGEKKYKSFPTYLVYGLIWQWCNDSDFTSTGKLLFNNALLNLIAVRLGNYASTNRVTLNRLIEDNVIASETSNTGSIFISIPTQTQPLDLNTMSLWRIVKTSSAT